MRYLYSPYFHFLNENFKFCIQNLQIWTGDPPRSRSNCLSSFDALSCLGLQLSNSRQLTASRGVWTRPQIRNWPTSRRLRSPFQTYPNLSCRPLHHRRLRSAIASAQPSRGSPPPPPLHSRCCWTASTTSSAAAAPLPPPRGSSSRRTPPFGRRTMCR